MLKYNFTPVDTSSALPDEPDAVAEYLPLIMSLCQNCKLVQMLDVVDPMLLFQNYSHAKRITSEVADHFDAYAQEAIKLGHLQKGDLVVDIGCGDGSMLKAFKNLGMKVIGVDPSLLSKAAAESTGFHLYNELFSPEVAGRILKEHGQASLVTANYVLGSIDNLHAVMAGVRHVLKNSGLFYFEEPYLADVLEQNLFDIFNHKRLTMFTGLPLEPFFRATRMHLVDARRFPFRKGTFRGIVQRSDGPHVVSGSLRAFIDAEINSKLHSIEVLNEFASRVEALKLSLQKMVTEFKSQGKLVAGYGASGRTVTFIYECGWQTGMLEYIVDDDQHKQGLLLPGTNINIVHPKMLRENPVDIVVLFAHNYSEHIISQHEEFRKAGGRFIIPFPMPKLV